MILTKVKNVVGATAIEYGLLASLIGVSAVSGMSAVGMNLSNTYCTISKHLGGSGTCSGATSSGSSGTGGSGSAGSSTGSVNSTNSLADGATIDQVKKGLQDELGTTYVPKEPFGGDDYPLGSHTFQSQFSSPSELQTMANDLSEINAKDPVTNVFGAYDLLTSGHPPVTDYQSVLTNLQNGGGNIVTGTNDSGVHMEVTTASGKVYTIYADDGGSVTTQENGPSPKNP